MANIRNECLLILKGNTSELLKAFIISGFAATDLY